MVVPLHSPSYRAALNALTKVAEEESRKLYAVIESEDSTEGGREQALRDLGRLARSLILRVANLEQAALSNDEDPSEAAEQSAA